MSEGKCKHGDKKPVKVYRNGMVDDVREELAPRARDDVVVVIRVERERHHIVASRGPARFSPI